MASSDPSSQAAGLVLGGYSIETALAEDWLGVRYQASDPVSGAPVLLRVLNARLARDPGLAAAVRAAPARQTGLRHPHLAALLDAGAAEGRLYLAFACAPGQSLAARLAGDPSPWPPDSALALLQPLATSRRPTSSWMRTARPLSATWGWWGRRRRAPARR